MCRLLEAQPEPPLTSNFVFLFSLILLLPFWVIFQLATHWKISIFQYSYLIPPLTHHHHPVSSPHIDIQKNSNLFFFSFLPLSIRFLREMMNYFGFPFCLLSSTRSPFNTRILCCPFRHSTFFFYLWMNFVPCHVDKSLVGLVPEKTLVSWVVGSLALSFSSFKNSEKDAERWWF